MLSINPKWCELIVNGEKTIEIRKTRPKISTPFKCYIYCTSVKNMPLVEYVDVHRKTGGRIDDWGGKVIGEFMCNRITPLFNICCDDWDRLVGDAHEYEKYLVNQACLTENELHKYANGKDCFAWHISNLVIYDTPSEINSDNLSLKRPPHSWCYVNVKGRIK